MYKIVFVIKLDSDPEQFPFQTDVSQREDTVMPS